MEEKNSMIKLGGLWVNQSANGNTYMNGSLGSARIMIFKNGYKETDKHPDYIMYLAENKPREDQPGQQGQGQQPSGPQQDRSNWYLPSQQGQAQAQAQQPAPKQPAPQQAPPNNDIPF